MRILSTILAALCIVGTVNCQQKPMGCNGVPNESPVLELPAQPLKTVPNGQSWKMEQDSNIVYIARLQGSPYEMGYAYGQLYGPEIAKNFANLQSYGYIKISGLLEKFGVPYLMINYIYSQLEPLFFYLLDLNWQVAKPFTPQRFIDELQGIAAGSNGTIDETILFRANMMPELIQAACSIVGSYGAASKDGKLYHLRALDWEPTAPVNEFPTVIIYEPSEEGSQSFANIGYMGLIGSLTAISKIGISVGEKVMYARPGDYPDPPHVTYYGQPWMFVLRDTVQFSRNIEEVERRLQLANRTMMIHLGFGSLPDNLFRGVDFAANFVTFYNDQNYTHYSQVHPQLEGVFYYDKHVQPSGDACIASILNATHGNITPETMYREIAGFHQTGDAQVVVMDPEGQQIWASWSQYGQSVNAFERSPIHIRLSDFWGTTLPNSLGGFLE